MFHFQYGKGNYMVQEELDRGKIICLDRGLLNTVNRK